MRKHNTQPATPGVTADRQTTRVDGKQDNHLADNHLADNHLADNRLADNHPNRLNHPNQPAQPDQPIPGLR